ncbi:unnamed protein product [Oikopleura dioica]|uniref:Uncharacterized protein n=1 Tax=Oikopleura dioica TaxID=34765 RepID=E4WZQ7_OIKDI|nr:unnamed protein product [Oikopleura dioica]
MSSSVRNTTRPLCLFLKPLYRPAVEAIDFITTTMQQNDDESTVSDEWRYIALIIDSLLSGIIILQTSD